MDKFHEIILGAKNILITSHVKPDWDAVSSVLATYDYLVKMYPEKNSKVFLNGAKNLAFDVFDKNDQINWVPDISEAVHEFDTIIFLDGNSLKRFSKNPDKIVLNNFKTVCIDHHPGEPDNFDLNLSDIKQASAAQLTYKLFFREKPELLSKEIAETILRGIIGDTGTFRFLDYQRSDTFIYVKELIDIAQTDVQILELPMNSMTPKEFELFQLLIKNTVNVELSDKPSLSYSFIPVGIFKEGYSKSEIRNAGEKYKTTILRQLSGHNWGFIVTPNSEDEVSASLRSTSGLVNVNKIASKLGGGGHVLASGVEFKIDGVEYKDSVDVCNTLVEYIKNNELELAT